MTSRWMALVALSIAAVAWAGGPADAEWALDAYGGAAWTQSADVAATGRDTPGTVLDAMIFDLKPTPGVTAGLRAGYWPRCHSWASASTSSISRFRFPPRRRPPRAR